jgi:predicted nucleic acid-binding protein
MIKVVCNTSPIIGLSSIDKLDLLWKMFDTIIPKEVYNEVISGNETKISGKEELIKAVEEAKISIFAVEDQEFINKIYGHLHKGELEVIIGAKEQNIEVVIIDEKSARKFAKDLGLKPIGILGILKLAKLEGKIDKLKPCLDMLIERKFRISESLYVKLLMEVGEN